MSAFLNVEDHTPCYGKGRLFDSVELADHIVDVDSVKAHHAEDVRAAFERLLMTPPPVGGAATRARNQARKKGWPVPLAWENPDNPRERPRCSRYAA